MGKHHSCLMLSNLRTDDGLPCTASLMCNIPLQGCAARPPGANVPASCSGGTCRVSSAPASTARAASNAATPATCTAGAALAGRSAPGPTLAACRSAARPAKAHATSARRLWQAASGPVWDSRASSAAWAPHDAAGAPHNATHDAPAARDGHAGDAAAAGLWWHAAASFRGALATRGPAHAARVV